MSKAVEFLRNEARTGINCLPPNNVKRSLPASVPGSYSRKFSSPGGENPGFLPVCTLVLWLGCLAVGAIGLALPYARPQAPVKEPDAIQAEVLKVELTSEPVAPPDFIPSENPSQPPLLEPMTAPEVAPMLAVAEPSPAIAFALPVKAPARIVEAKQASYTQPKESVINAILASVRNPEPLVYGQGEGKQPKPDYPVKAKREGQEGTVIVRFSVDERGRVLEAEAKSPWPLLTESALQAVRHRWRFRPGPTRLFEVPIRFELPK